jgi:hypothetical protein
MLDDRHNTSTTISYQTEMVSPRVSRMTASVVS